MTSTFIIPFSIKKFDIVKYLSSNQLLLIKTDKIMEKGDALLFYISAPYKQILFQGVVIDNKPSAEVIHRYDYAIDKSSNYPRYILAEIIHAFKEGSLPISVLKELGVGQVLRQCRADNRVVEYINSKLEDIYVS